MRKELTPLKNLNCCHCRSNWYFSPIRLGVKRVTRAYCELNLTEPATINISVVKEQIMIMIKSDVKVSMKLKS